MSDEEGGEGTSVADPDPHLKSLPDPDRHRQMRIRIQEVKSLENVQVHEVNTVDSPNSGQRT